MKKTILMFVFIFSLGLFSLVNAESINGTEWWVLNITNETVDENSTTWGNVSNYTTNPQINNSPQFDVLATMDATLWWAEVQLNTTEINFGNVEKENAYLQRYRIKARGTVDIRVTPKLKNENDDFFSNLKFSRTTGKTTFEPIGEYSINFVNLSKNNKNWSVIGANNQLKNSTTSEKASKV